MSAYPDADIRVQAAPSAWLSPVQFAAAATALAVPGLLTITPTVLALWTMWRTDALKSVGMAIPLVSLALILRAWKGLDWRADGTWWGVPVLLLAMAGSWVEGRSNLVLVLTPQISRIFPPASLVVLAYGSGVVLLFGGWRLYRAALFPILLLLLVDPIPHAFNQWIDLPLQRYSAYVARALAMHLGQSLTPDRLRLMFTPGFGMFIAPGCNGIRGAVTMGLIALVAGYLYRFRWTATGMVVAGAILLGYVFNLLRLCLLVLYYLVALHLPWLQDKAEGADYIIGAGLFLLATVLLFAAIHRLRDEAPPGETRTEAVAADDMLPDGAPVQLMRLAAMAAMALIGSTGVTQAIAETHAISASVSDADVQLFPARLGAYTRERTWNETLKEGAIIYAWAQYAPTGGGPSIAIGVSPVSDWHNPLICHTAHGQDPVWQGQLNMATAETPVEFSSGFYNDGATQYLEASTLCSGGSCGEFATERRHLGFVLSAPRFKSLVGADSTRSTRVLIRVETLNVAEPADSAREELTQRLRAFLASVKLGDLTRPYDDPR